MIKKIDWAIMGSVLFLCFIGFVGIISASLKYENFWFLILKQSIALIIGMLLLFFFCLINYRIFQIYYVYLFVFSLILLTLVLFFGSSVRGSKAWFNFGFFSFQPSELAKIIFVVSIAAYLDNKKDEIQRLTKLFLPFLFLGLHVFLLYLQPDFSSTLIYPFLFLSMLYVSNIRRDHFFWISMSLIFAILLSLLLIYFSSIEVSVNSFGFYYSKIFYDLKYTISAILICGFVLFFVWWFLKKMLFNIPIHYFIIFFIVVFSSAFFSKTLDSHLKVYQKKRFVTFINPNIDPTGFGYSLSQSKIGIGSGRLFGKGLFSGSQTQLGFIPEAHTDFIFSVLSEELGFFFSFLVLLAFFILVWRCFIIAKSANDNFGTILTVGLSSMFSFYIVYNIGMSLGLLPVIGLPLPFLSYGGSFLISCLISIGIIFSVYIRRFSY